MIKVLLAGVDEELAALALDHATVQVAPDAQAAEALLQQPASVDVLVVGTALPAPVRLAQRAQEVDRERAVILLSDAEHLPELSRAVRFTPLLSGDVTCLAAATLTEVRPVVAEAVARVRQRRRHRAQLDAVNAQLGRLAPAPLTTEYVERLLDHAPLGVVELDAGGRVQSWNQRASVLLEHTEREALGLTFLDLFPTAEQVQLQRYLGEGGIDGHPGTPLVVRRPQRDGQEYFLEVTSTALTGRDRQAGRLVLLQDVTERISAERARERAEQALREQHEWLAVTLASIGDAVIATDARGRISFINRVAEQLTGWSASEAAGQPLADVYVVVNESSRRRIDDPVSRVLRENAIVGLANHTVLLRRDGAEIPIDDSGAPIRDASNRIIGVVLVFRDVTERKQAEAALRQRQQEVRELIEHAPDIIARYDRQLRHLYVNPVIEQITGLPPAAFIGRTNADLGMPPELVAAWDEALSRVFATGQATSLDFAYQALAGQRWYQARIVPERGPDGAVQTALAMTRDISDRKHAEEVLRFLAEAGQILTSSLDYEEILRRVAGLVVPRLADWCIIDVVDEAHGLQRLVVAAADADEARWRGALDQVFPLTPDAPVGPGHVVRTRQSELVSEVTLAHPGALAGDAARLEHMQRLGIASYICVLLRARGIALGAITLATGAARHLGAADLDLVEELAHHASQTIDNARLFRAERHARQAAEHAAERTARLQAITAALAGALSAEQVAHPLVEHGVAAVGAAAGAVALLTYSGANLEVVHAVGDIAALASRTPRIPLDEDSLLAEVVRTCEPRWIEGGAGGQAASVAVPLVIDRRPLGVLALSFPGPRSFSADDRELITALAQQAAQALDRVHLYEAQQRARADAETARQRLAFLAEASSVLAGSLDYQHTLQAVGRLVVPHLADWCVIDVVEDEGVQRLAVVHRDPARADICEELRRRFPADPSAAAGAGKVLRTGRPELHATVTPEVERATARFNPELQAMLRRLGMRSYIVVPLVARGRPLGVLSLVIGEPGRQYGPAELALAEELARRAALAIENARLYREAQRAIQERENFVSTASHELRTPLTTIKVYASLLARQLGAEEWDRARIDHFSTQLEGQINRLEMLVVDLLDASRIQQGRLELRLAPMNLSALAQQVLTRFEHAPERTERHTLHLDAAPSVVGVWDASRLDQVLTNLISNALKYSPAGGEVRLSIVQRDDEVELAVSDQGIGIAASEQVHLFRPFARAASVLRGISGVGLGLYIVRHIVEQHGGSVELNSTPGAGSTFVVRLPRVALGAS